MYGFFCCIGASPIWKVIKPLQWLNYLQQMIEEQLSACITTHAFFEKLLKLILMNAAFVFQAIT